MNFSPFGGHFSTAIPTIHQSAAKFHDNPICPPPVQDNSSRYTANGVPSFTQHHPPQQQQQQPQPQQQQHSKFHSSGGAYAQGSGYLQQNGRQEKRHAYGQEHQELGQERLLQHLQQQEKYNVEKVKSQSNQDSTDRRNHHQQPQQTLQNHHQQQQTQQTNQTHPINSSTPTTLPASWQSLAATGSAVADYLSHLPVTTLTLSLHQYLEYKAENMKKETSSEGNMNLLSSGGGAGAGVGSGAVSGQVQQAKKKKKKKPEKEKKPRPKPGEIRLTTALDGSTLYCCPECHMAYPEKELLEQHLVGHTLERRFVCDICGAGLKRKDHLTRHKQSHNPERPYVCTVCLKAFKRKEQLTLHFVIHSGEKRHVCTECGKGFYRKDHLRKHTRSHIARRVKAELSQQAAPSVGNAGLQLPGNGGGGAAGGGTVALQGILS